MFSTSGKLTFYSVWGVKGYKRAFTILFLMFICKIKWKAKVNFIGKKHKWNSDLLWNLPIKLNYQDADRYTHTLTHINKYVHTFHVWKLPFENWIVCDKWRGENKYMFLMRKREILFLVMDLINLFMISFESM